MSMSMSEKLRLFLLLASLSSFKLTKSSLFLSMRNLKSSKLSSYWIVMGMWNQFEGEIKDLDEVFFLQHGNAFLLEEFYFGC